LKKIHEASTDRIAEWMTALYPQRKYPAVMLGSSNGAVPFSRRKSRRHAAPHVQSQPGPAARRPRLDYLESAVAKAARCTAAGCDGWNGCMHLNRPQPGALWAA
jgi:hypothetical protein